MQPSVQGGTSARRSATPRPTFALDFGSEVAIWNQSLTDWRSGWRLVAPENKLDSTDEVCFDVQSALASLGFRRGSGFKFSQNRRRWLRLRLRDSAAFAVMVTKRVQDRCDVAMCSSALPGFVPLSQQSVMTFAASTLACIVSTRSMAFLNLSADSAQVPLDQGRSFASNRFAPELIVLRGRGRPPLLAVYQRRVPHHFPETQRSEV